MNRAALIVVATIGGCALPDRPAPQAPAVVVSAPRIVVSERGTGGARLVALDEHGDRQFIAVALPAGSDTLVRDTNPAISPDGKWLAFVSSRGRNLDETSLWLAPLGREQVPVRLTTEGIDSQPAWTRDGAAIVFASTRAGRGDFDLWSYTIATRALARLTDGDDHEVTPTVARDGTIYCSIVSRTTGAARIVRRAVDGTITDVTSGPADTSPALSPDEHTLAFARAVEHASGKDAELFVVTLAGASASANAGDAPDAAASQLRPARVVDLPLTDEGGPVWSPDGRYLFATSALRGETGATLWASVIVVDRAEVPVRARVLEDRAGAIARLTPAIARAPLDAAAIRANPEYLPELSNIIAAAIARRRADSTDGVHQ